MAERGGTKQTTLRIKLADENLRAQRPVVIDLQIRTPAEHRSMVRGVQALYKVKINDPIAGAGDLWKTSQAPMRRAR